MGRQASSHLWHDRWNALHKEAFRSRNNALKHRLGDHFWHICLRLTRCDYAGDYYLLPGARSSLLDHDEFFGATWGRSLGEVTPQVEG